MLIDIIYYNCNVFYYPVYFIIFLLAEKICDFLDKPLLLVLHIEFRYIKAQTSHSQSICLQLSSSSQSPGGI